VLQLGRESLQVKTISISLQKQLHMDGNALLHCRKAGFGLCADHTIGARSRLRLQSPGPGFENLISWQLAGKWQVANTAAF
jgi:hypothetical protein